MALTIIGSDLHAPYTDEVAFAKFVSIIRDEQPDRIIINGDTFDMYQVSRFDKDPNRMGGLQDDIDNGIDKLLTIRSAAPNARIDVTEGNHERRWLHYLMRNPEIMSLRELTPQKLFGIDRIGAIWTPYQQSLEVDGNRAIHGHIVRKRSGFTAHANIDVYNTSGTNGHSHRLCTVYRTVNGRRLTWTESGCLCQLDPEYMPSDTADWQHGYVRIEDGEMMALPL